MSGCEPNSAGAATLPNQYVTNAPVSSGEGMRLCEAKWLKIRSADAASKRSETTRCAHGMAGCRWIGIGPPDREGLRQVAPRQQRRQGHQRQHRGQNPVEEAGRCASCVPVPPESRQPCEAAEQAWRGRCAPPGPVPGAAASISSSIAAIAHRPAGIQRDTGESQRGDGVLAGQHGAGRDGRKAQAARGIRHDRSPAQLERVESRRHDHERRGRR